MADGRVDGGKIYRKGRRYEYKICKQERSKGCDIVFRSAGSHSPVDVVSIDTASKIIRLIQCKAGGSYSIEKRDKLGLRYATLNGPFQVKFIVE